MPLDRAKFISDAVTGDGDRGANGPVTPKEAITAEAIAEALRLLPPAEQSLIREQTSSWNAGANMANAATGGALLPVMEWLAGTMGYPMPGRFREAKKQWEQENPLYGATTEIIGSLPLALGAAAVGQHYIAVPAARIAATAAPRLLEAFPSAARVLGEAFGGGVQGAAGALATSGLSDRPVMDQMREGAAFGAVANPVMYAGRRVIGLESSFTPETLNAAKAAQRAGIPLRPGQLQGASWGLRLQEALSGQPGRERALYNRLSEALGNPTGVIDQQWLNSTRRQHGNVMEIIEMANKWTPDQRTLNEMSALRSALSSRMDTANEQKVRGLIEDVAKNIISHGGMAGIPGKVFKNMVGKDGLVTQFTKNENPAVAAAAKELKEILEGTYGRTLPQSEREAWTKARQSYKFLSAIDEQLSTGKPLDPNALVKAVESRTGGDYTKARVGDVNLGDIAHGASAVMKPGQGVSLHPTHTQRTGLGLAANLALAGGATGGLGAAYLAHEPTREMARQIAHDPIGTAAPVAGSALATLLGLKLLGSRVNTPKALERTIEAARRGAEPQHFGGVNPLLQVTSPEAWR